MTFCFITVIWLPATVCFMQLQIVPCKQQTF